MKIEGAAADLGLLGDVVDAALGDAVAAKHLERRDVHPPVGLFTLLVTDHHVRRHLPAWGAR